MNCITEENSYRYYCIGFILPSIKLWNFNLNFISDLNEEINSLTGILLLSF